MSEPWPGTQSVSDREVVFTLSRGYRLPLVLRGSVALVLTAGAATAAKFSGSEYIIAAVFCGLATLGYAAAYIWRGRFRTVLTPGGIRIRGYFNHFVPWPDVAGFAVRGDFAAQPLDAGSGSQHIAVYRESLRGQLAPPRDSRKRPGVANVHVVRREGRRLLLRAPFVTGWQSDSHFDDKVRLMERWRRQYGATPPVTPAG